MRAQHLKLNGIYYPFEEIPSRRFLFHVEENLRDSAVSIKRSLPILHVNMTNVDENNIKISLEELRIMEVAMESKVLFSPLLITS